MLMSMRAAFQEKPAKTVRFGLVCRGERIPASAYNSFRKKKRGEICFTIGGRAGHNIRYSVG